MQLIHICHVLVSEPHHIKEVAGRINNLLEVLFIKRTYFITQFDNTFVVVSPQEESQVPFKIRFTT